MVVTVVKTVLIFFVTVNEMTRNILKKETPYMLSALNNVALGLSVGLPIALHFQPQLDILMHAISGLNAFHALSNTIVLSTGLYDLSKQKKSKTIESMMISFGVVGASAFGLSKFSTERSLVDYRQKLKQNIEYTTDQFVDLPLEKKRLNLHYLRNEAAEYYFPLSKEKSSIFLTSHSLFGQTVAPPDGLAMAESFQTLIKTSSRQLSLQQNPDMNLSKYIEEELLLRKNLPQEGGVFSTHDPKALSYKFHNEARNIADLIETQQKYYRVMFSKFLLYDSLLNGVNAGFSFAGGVSALYNYFQKKENKPFSPNDL